MSANVAKNTFELKRNPGFDPIEPFAHFHKPGKNLERRVTSFGYSVENRQEKTHYAGYGGG